MQNFIQIIIVLFLFQISLQQKGCLLLDQNFTCVLCDFFTGYSPNAQNECELSKIENCQIQNLKKICLLCDQNYYFDSNTGKCIAVENQVENCQIYIKNNQCKQCKTNYVLKNSQCVQLENTIEGCKIYQNNGECLYCQTGYVIGIDNLSCTQIQQPVENCLAYNFIMCEECESGYVHNPSYYSFSSVSQMLDKANLVVSNYVFQNQDSVFLNVCQPQQVTNCISYQNFKECKVCKENYYLTSDLQCSPFPSSRIENCLVYLSVDKCKICEQTYHVSDLGQCVKNTEIENCLKYDQSTSITTCIQCKQDYYVLSNKCIDRVNKSITNCTEYYSNQDSCEQCKEDYQPTNDGLRCLPVINNCKIYQASDNQATLHQCELCVSGFYLTDEKQCALGTIQNCDIYQDDKTCFQCENKYYKENGNCIEQANLLQCFQYDQTQTKKCTLCQNNSILMSTGKMCQVVSNIQGCDVYLDSGNCQQCQEGYKLLQTNDKLICAEIEKYPNCLQLDQSGTKCAKCKQNFVLFQFFDDQFNDLVECQNPQGYYNENCRENNLQSGMTFWKDAKCVLCEYNYIPYNQQNQFACFKLKFVKVLLGEKNQNILIAQNCQKLAIEQNQYKCIQCIEGYFLQNQSCVEVCKDHQQENGIKYPLNLVEIESFTDNNVNKFRIKKVRSCYNLQQGENDPLYNCKYLSPVFTNNDHSLQTVTYLQKCIKCEDNTIPVVGPNQVFFSPQNYQPIENVTNLTQLLYNQQSPSYNAPVLFQVPISKCLKQDLPSIHKVQNCKFYRQISSEYYCSRCEDYYKGEISKKEQKYYISKCVPIDTCTALFYPGLPAILNFMTTCYECFEGKIPVIFASKTTDADGYLDINSEHFQPYDPTQKVGRWADNYIAQQDAKGNGYNVECYDRNSSQIAINIDFPLQCALGIYWVPNNIQTPSAEHMKQKYNVNQQKIQLICAACKPGYKREGAFYGIDQTTKRVKYMIQDCLEIQNCNRSQWLNYCSSCNKNYAFSITNQRVNYDECIYTSDQNCFAIDKTTQKCKICKKGYTFNYDEVCEQFSPPSCSQYNQFDNLETTMVSTLLYMFQDGKGCNKCNNQEIALKMSDRSISCVSSDYIQNQTITSSSKYIKNCMFYFNESGQLKCQECKEGFVVNNIFTICYSKSGLSNCEIALDSEKCLQCINEYISVDYKCKQKNLLNCLVYDSDSSLTQQTCIQCNSGYYLNKNQCLIGDIEYCDVYGQNLNQCQKCQNGYQKIQIKDADYCLKIDPRSFCEDVDQIKFQNQIIECNKCREGQNLYLTQLIPIDQEKTMCITINEISNCLEYETQLLFQNSTLKCYLCAQGFYTSGFRCKQIKNIDQNCQEYERDKDQCKICKDSYFLNKSFQCLQNPSGIQGCKIYKNQTDCKICKENYFLQSNFCNLVEESKRIKNCLYYENPELCLECKEQYYLVNNQCVEVLAQNCETYEDINNCLSCQKGWGLKKENSKTNCVQITDPNCLDYEIEFPFACLKCAFGFYPDEGGVCQPVLNAIDDCLTYKSDTACSQCKKGYVLTPDFSKCISSSKLKINVDPNCKYTYQISKPNCQICKAGYYMDPEYNCKKCEGNNCLFCDSINTKKCTICNFGYYMNSKFECVGETIQIDQQIEEVQEFIFNLRIINLKINNMFLKIFCLLMIACQFNMSELYKRKYVDIEMMRAVVQNEVEGMESHSEIFSSLNIYYKICLQSIIPMLDNLALSPEDNYLYCKMIENTMPMYILPIFVIDPSKNKEIIENIIREFFKSYIELNYNLEQIRIPKIYEKNIALLYNLRDMFVLTEGFYEKIIAKFLPEDYSLFTEQAFNQACDEFIDLIIFKIMSQLKDFLATDPKIFILTFFEQFEHEPFEFIQFFLNDISFISKEFESRFKRRRLYLIDNLDNLALKSFSIFKQDKKSDLMKTIAKEAKIANDENPDATGLEESDIESFKNLQEFLNKDPYDPKKTEDSHFNFKMINACIKYSAFKSQSLEKLYCYYITYNIPSSDFILKHEKYNELLGYLFQENSEQYLGEFIKLKPSYFSDESQYYEEVYPRFKIELNKAAVAFKQKYAKLLEKFYDDYSLSIKKNFMYYWRKILLQFLNNSIFVPGVGPQTLYSNLINFFQFSKENYSNKETVDYFSLNELIEKYVTLYHKNIIKFTQFE